MDIRKDSVLCSIHILEFGYVPLEGYGLTHNALSFLRTAEFLAINVNHSISPAQGDVMKQKMTVCMR